MEAASNGDLDAMKSLLADHPSLNINYYSKNDRTFEKAAEWDQDSEGYLTMNDRWQSALYIACAEGHAFIVEWLLHLPDIEVDCRTQDERTPLFAACVFGDLEIVKSAFYVACEFRHLEVVEELLKDKRVYSTRRDNDNLPLLYCACAAGLVEIARRLLKGERWERENGEVEDEGADSWSNYELDVNEEDYDGCTALHKACESDFVEVVELLLSDPRVDVNHRGSQGMTPSSLPASFKPSLSSSCSWPHLASTRTLGTRRILPSFLLVRRGLAKLWNFS